VSALAGLAGVLSAAPAFAADPFQFATLTGPCTTNGNTVYGAPVTSPHAHILMRYTVTSGAAYLDSSVDSIAAGDVIWNPRTAGLNTNDPPSVYAFCDSPETFTATFFDVPTTPTTFSGIGNNTTGSTVEFVAPGSGQYVADLSLSGGGVSMNAVGYLAFGHLTNLRVLRTGRTHPSLHEPPRPLAAPRPLCRRRPRRLNSRAPVRSRPVLCDAP
jgi:hypothetical protein